MLGVVKFPLGLQTYGKKKKSRVKITLFNNWDFKKKNLYHEIHYRKNVISRVENIKK